MYTSKEFPICELMRSIHLKIKNMMDQFFSSYGVTGVQAMVLHEIFLNKDIKVTDLAHQLNMTNSNLSAICRRLENNGMIVRKRDSQDQRIIKVTLTSKTMKMAEHVMQMMEEDYLPIFQTATQQDKEDIIRGLTKLDQLLTKQEAL